MNGTKLDTEAADAPARVRGRRASHRPLKGHGQRALEEVRVIMPERVTINQVRILVAESLRFPGEGKSAQGKSGPKTRPKGVVDGQRVNIPAPRLAVEGVRTLLVKGACPVGGAARKGEANYDAEVPKPRAKKSRRRTKTVPVLKLTQVGGMSILRRSRERW
jgi:hypothetical protein